MNDAFLNIRTDKTLKKQAAKLADNLGFSLSTLVNAYLKHFVKTKTVHFEESYTPTPYLKRMIVKAEKEHDEGKYVSFDNPRDAVRYLDSVIKSK